MIKALSDTRSVRTVLAMQVAGRSGCTSSTVWRSLVSTSSIYTSSLYITVMTLADSMLMLAVYRTRSSPARASSSLLVTNCSTSSGEAPG